MIRRPHLGLAALLGAACRFGGPEGSATALIEVDAGQLPAESGDDGFADDSDLLGGDFGSTDAQRPVPERMAAPEAVPSDARTAAGADAALATCAVPAGLACDPVSGLGCLPLMQCAVDPSGSAPAAHCIFSGLQLDATCTEDAVSTNCPPQHTCVMGACRKYCYCDTDCEQGAACAGASIPGGGSVFKLCEPATP